MDFVYNLIFRKTHIRKNFSDANQKKSTTQHYGGELSFLYKEVQRWI